MIIRVQPWHRQTKNQTKPETLADQPTPKVQVPRKPKTENREPGTENPQAKPLMRGSNSEKSMLPQKPQKLSAILFRLLPPTL
jgi:hypothetical protein